MNNVSLHQYLKEHLLVGDGAMATQLYQRGVPVGVCYEELCLSNPQIVRSVHDAYIAAGAQLIETNTFGVNREALLRFGLDHKVQEISQAAVTIARESAGENAFVVGSIGSIVAGRIRTGGLDHYRPFFEEQAEALLTHEVDGLILETFLDLDELLLAIEVIRPLTNQVIIAQLATLEVGHTRDGYTVNEAFRQLRQAGADVIGLNCRLGPAEMLRTLDGCDVPNDTPISIFPNAGRLGLSDGEYRYKSSPEYFAQSAMRFYEQGVRMIGGCCGTTPEHIRVMAEALKGLTPQCFSRQAIIEPEPSERVQITVRQRPTLVETVKKQPTVIVEFDPPKDLDTEEFFNGCYALHSAGAAAITLADNALANVRMSNMALGALLKNRFGIEPIVHMTCRDRNLIGQQSHLMGLNALEIDHVLVITGDPSRFGDLPGSSSVFDVNSFDMIRMTKQLNEGISFSGRPLKRKAQFVVGAAFNPNVMHFEKAIERLERKVAVGADYIMTQPIYDPKVLRHIYEATKHLEIPIFIGIMPLTSQRNAEFLHHEVPGIRLSQEVMARMTGLTGKAARQEGIALAQELIDEALQYFNGIYLMTPFNYYEMTAELTKYVHDFSGLKQRSSEVS